jgi:prepilin-type processing-associated H-X9-DG protein
MLMSANSYHTGGANFGLGDGSVTFVSETINATGSGTMPTNPIVSGGSSNFGVWGAAGSINGSESTSL